MYIVLCRLLIWNANTKLYIYECVCVCVCVYKVNMSEPLSHNGQEIK